MKTLYARQLLNDLLTDNEIKLLEIVSEDQDVKEKVKEIVESRDIA